MDDTDSTLDMLRDAATDFLNGQAGRERLRGWIGAPRPVERALWHNSAAQGWTGVMLEEDLGGVGLGLRGAAVLCEEAGRHAYAEPLVAAVVMPSVLLTAAKQAGAPRAGALLEQLLAGESLLAFAWQEVPGQVALPEGGATLLDGRLSGARMFVQGCEADSSVLVWSHECGEPVIVALDAGAAGVTHSVRAAGLGSHAELRFDAVRIDAGAVLLRGDAAARAGRRAIAAARIAAAAELAGLASGCLAQTLEHVRSRQQFDRALGSFQSVQHRCVDLHIEIELARAGWLNALDMYEACARDDELPDGAEAAICAAKARAGDAAVRVGREAVQLHGAMGFCEEVDIGLYLRAALHGSAWLGNGMALRRRFAALTAGATQQGSGVSHV